MRKIYSYKFRTPFGIFCLKATSKGLYSCDVIASRAKGGAKQSRGSRLLRPHLDRRLAMTEGKKIPPRVQSLLKEGARKVSSYLRGQKVNFPRFPLDWSGLGPFEQRVLRELRKIPSGRTRSYQFLAQKAGKPEAARAVGRILHLNRLPFILPCHRIIPKRGGLGGFSRGIGWKKRLLKIERERADTKSRGREWGKYRV